VLLYTKYSETLFKNGETQRKEKDMNEERRGGKREGAGRPKTTQGSKVMRIPLEKVAEVEQLIKQKDNELTKTKTLTIFEIVERWEAQSTGKENNSRWINVIRLLAEIRKTLGEKPDSSEWQEIINLADTLKDALVKQKKGGKD